MANQDKVQTFSVETNILAAFGDSDRPVDGEVEAGSRFAI